MKKIVLLSLVVASALVLTNCKSKEKITKDATEIQLPFSENKYQSDKDHFRAKNYGKSPDLATAKKIAMQNAKSEMAGNISSTIKTVTDQYVNQRQVADAVEFENKFEELSRNVVNQKLVDVVVIGEKALQEKDGHYTYWIAIETSKDAILEGVSSAISRDKKIALDYDKHKYEETFNKEMEKFEQNY